MSSHPREFSLTSNRVGRYVGRLIGGSWGRPCKDRHARANRGVRRSVKRALNMENYDG